MKPSRWVFFLLAGLLLNSPAAWAFEFYYQFRAGDRFRILSTVNYHIIVDRNLRFRNETVNRIAKEITEVIGSSARINAVSQSATRTVRFGPGGRVEAAADDLFEWSTNYYSAYEQDRLGRMSIGPQYVMPTVRDVPVFPGRELQIGETWSAPGVAVHDFRESFGFEEPLRLPFHALYTFLGEREWRGRTYPAFSVSYRIMERPDPLPGRLFPRRIQEAFDKTVFWDAEMGRVAAFEGNFRTVLELSNGETWEFRGRAEAEVVESPPMDREELLREIIEDIANIPDATVRLTDEGIVISLEDIQFAPDSAVLLPTELAKLDVIAEILMRHPDRDILVTGHTALAGTPESRLQLSIERAGTVADYLLRRNIRTPDRVVIRGYGADRPVADNITSEGMRRNRRVEIIILEN